MFPGFFCTFPLDDLPAGLCNFYQKSFFCYTHIFPGTGCSLSACGAKPSRPYLSTPFEGLFYKHLQLPHGPMSSLHGTLYGIECSTIRQDLSELVYGSLQGITVPLGCRSPPETESCESQKCAEELKDASEEELRSHYERRIYRVYRLVCRHILEWRRVPRH